MSEYIYEASFIHWKVTRYRLVKETSKQVVIADDDRGRHERYHKSTMYASFHSSFDEAKAALESRVLDRIDSAKRSLDRWRTHLDKVRRLKDDLLEEMRP